MTVPYRSWQPSDAPSVLGTEADAGKEVGMRCTQGTKDAHRELSSLFTRGLPCKWGEANLQINTFLQHILQIYLISLLLKLLAKLTVWKLSLLFPLPLYQFNLGENYSLNYHQECLWSQCFTICVPFTLSGSSTQQVKNVAVTLGVLGVWIDS